MHTRPDPRPIDLHNALVVETHALKRLQYVGNEEFAMTYAWRHAAGQPTDPKKKGEHIRNFFERAKREAQIPRDLEPECLNLTPESLLKGFNYVAWLGPGKRTLSGSRMRAMKSELGYVCSLSKLRQPRGLIDQMIDSLADAGVRLADGEVPEAA